MNDYHSLCWQANRFYCAGNYQQAAELYRRARLVAEARADHSKRVCALYWEGDCLSAIGELDAALAILLEGATTDPGLADPAEVFNCWITAVGISIPRKPYSFSRGHLDEIRKFVDRHGLTRSLHRFYFSEGRLEYVRGNFAQARDLLLRSLETHRPQYPYLSRGTHLYLLCATLFWLRDEAGLARWVKAFEETHCDLEQDRIKLLLARLMLCRARGLMGTERAIANDTAQTLLIRIDGLRRNLDGFYSPLITALDLLGNHAEVERLVNRLDAERFETKLLKADLFLSRARAVLGLPAVDDDWADELAAPEPVAPSGPEPIAYLAAAATLYKEAVAALAAESGATPQEWRRRLISNRLSRVDAIRRAAMGGRGCN
jgi:tetratricopeptide (TPR) repeat protein